MRNTNRLGIGLLLALGILAFGQEKSLKPAEVPSAVSAAVARRFPTGTVSRWSTETEDGKTTYEASVKDAAGKRDVVLAPNGSLVAIEEAIAVSEVPSAAKGAVLSKYPHARIKDAERVSHDGRIDYEVDLANAARHEVTVSGEGKILKEE